MLKSPLPIDAYLPEIIQKLSTAGAVVLKADPGAGKTTRVPPAILDAASGVGRDAAGEARQGTAGETSHEAAGETSHEAAGETSHDTAGENAGDPRGLQPGQVVVLQPRRIAARSAAARMSQERGTRLGAEVGYQVRHEGRWSNRTSILVCTEGIFLRRIQNDPLLQKTYALVFDEFHERSVDSDLALAMVREVREQVRSDLKVVVMSATLDCAPIARYLGNCETVECPGRTFPVEIEFLKFPPSAPIAELVVDGVTRMFQHDATTYKGIHEHLLAFLPGVGEIRRTQEMLEARLAKEKALIMPLYGDMPLEAQQAVLGPSNQRKIILATNVAETSLTVDGVTAVVDSGLARFNRFQAQTGLNSLEIDRISKASADQRSGRAGRTAPGRCLRLWTERQHLALRDFDVPEILRVDLSQCVLQLHAWGQNDVYEFPWFEPPPSDSIAHALALLTQLGALKCGKLTEIGRQMSLLPVQPRLARLVLEGRKLGFGARAALCASLLSARDPLRRDESLTQTRHHSDSDVLDRLQAMEDFDTTGKQNSIVGSLMIGPSRQILRGGAQLANLCKDSYVSADSDNAEDSNAAQASVNADAAAKADEAILRSILSAFPDRVCKRRQSTERRALMVGGRGVRLSDLSAIGESDLFVAVELSETGKAETLVRQASAIEKSWLSPAMLSDAVEVEYDVARRRVVAFKRTRYLDLVVDEVQTQIPSGVDASVVLAQGIGDNIDIESLIDDDARLYVIRLKCLREWMPELDLPSFGGSPWKDFLPEWCMGVTSVADLSAGSLIACIQSRLSPQQLAAVEEEAPAAVELPSGRKVKLAYEEGSPPVMAARIQDLFGMTETPRIARGRVALLMHLLAPNNRVQQITPDLSSFWRNTYPEVRKELKGRYPKHAWPEDPLSARPIERPKRH